MTRYDFTPYFRTTVGFDRMMRLLDTVTGNDDAAQGYPPYNIEKTGEDAYRITMAVAGFGEDDLHIETRDNTLWIASKSQEDEPAEGEYLYRGIARRSFRRSFRLADHVKVVGANLDNGLLHIDLVREVPEEMKPRNIEITRGAPKTIAGKARKLVETAKKVA